MNPIFFSGPTEFRTWLERHHATATELLVGLHRKGAKKPGLTYLEAIEEALCFGWIDGVTRRLDAHRYAIRFTPRKPRSNWSLINIGRVQRLTKLGRMHPAGLAAFARRDPRKTGVYSFESRPKKLPAAFERKFRSNRKAWAFFNSQAPSYQRTAIFLVLSAKQEATRERRLERLIADSAAGQRIAALRKPTPARD